MVKSRPWQLGKYLLFLHLLFISAYGPFQFQSSNINVYPHPLTIYIYTGNHDALFAGCELTSYFSYYLHILNKTPIPYIWWWLMFVQWNSASRWQAWLHSLYLSIVCPPVRSNATSGNVELKPLTLHAFMELISYLAKSALCPPHMLAKALESLLMNKVRGRCSRTGRSQFFWAFLVGFYVSVFVLFCTILSVGK